MQEVDLLSLFKRILTCGKLDCLSIRKLFCESVEDLCRNKCKEDPCLISPRFISAKDGQTLHILLYEGKLKGYIHIHTSKTDKLIA